MVIGRDLRTGGGGQVGLAEVSNRLRQQVDLATLTAELLAVVEDTMQPTSMSLWLRPSHTAAQDQHSTGAPHADRQPAMAGVPSGRG